MSDLSHRIAWLAGILDGEGCIAVYTFKGYTSAARSHRNWRVRPVLAVTNTDDAMIHEIAAVFREVGVTSYVIQPHNDKRKPYLKPAWRIQICSFKQIVPVLKAVRPYLITKAAQADLTLEIAEHRMAVCGKGKRWTQEANVEEDVLLHSRLEKLAALNHRGPNSKPCVALTRLTESYGS